MTYAKAVDKIIAAVKRKKDSSKDVEPLARFKGEFPPSLLRVMSGECVAPDVGFHKIAMQMAITANALGKKEEDMLSLAEGVVANHQSDGTRYNSPRKRREELSRMFRYTQDNVCYLYNRAAVKALVPKGTPAPDLDGVPSAAGAVTAEGNNGND